VKAVVASSRLGSASSSHGSIQESHKANQEPSPTQDSKEDSKTLPEAKKIQGDGAQVAAEDQEAELMKVQPSEEVKDADVNAEEALRMVPKALEDGIKVDDPAIEKSPGEEPLKTVEETTDSKEEQENPVVGLGVPQQDVILPEY
jgi:calcium/calmodulin-dependent protein kinase-4